MTSAGVTKEAAGTPFRRKPHLICTKDLVKDETLTTEKYKCKLSYFLQGLDVTKKMQVLTLDVHSDFLLNLKAETGSKGNKLSKHILSMF